MGGIKRYLVVSSATRPIVTAVYFPGDPSGADSNTQPLFLFRLSTIIVMVLVKTINIYLLIETLATKSLVASKVPTQKSPAWICQSSCSLLQKNVPPDTNIHQIQSSHIASFLRIF